MSEFVENATQLIEALKNGVKKVGVRYVKLSDEEATAVAEMIASNSTTQRLRYVNIIYT